MENELKSILLELVGQVEDLRATLGSVAQFPNVQPTIAEDREAKNVYLSANKGTFDKLRKQIEELS